MLLSLCDERLLQLNIGRSREHPISGTYLLLLILKWPINEALERSFCHISMMLKLYQSKYYSKVLFKIYLNGMLSIILSTSVTFIFRELLDNIVAQKHQKPFSTEHSQLVELLLQKDTDLKATLKVK